jgi:glycosyltransferase involved in cell wall biosynthesis
VRILLVSDGKYPENVNGVSIYLDAFARHISDYATVGVLYVQNSKLFGKPYTRAHKNKGIFYFGIQNSPLFMGDSLENPSGNLSQKDLENQFRRILLEFRPNLVHIHELHRMPVSIVDDCKRQDIPVFITLHDYWYLCPLFQLFTSQETICSGPDFGRNCVITCLAGEPIRRFYRRCLRISQGTELNNILLRFRNRFKKLRNEPLWQTSRHHYVPKNHRNIKLSKKILELGRRQIQLKRILYEANALHAVSNACAQKYIQHGVPEERIQVLQLGLPAKKFLKPNIKTFRQPPLKLGFLGTLGPSKGAQLLMEAAEYFTPQSVEFHIYGKAREEDVALIKQHAGKSKNIFYHGKYALEDLENIFGQFHLLVIPSLWVETLGLIGLEAQAAGVPVLASDVGGMTDYVKEGKNGMLFQQGSVSALVACINNILQRPELIEKMSRNVIEPIGMYDHCRDMERLYQGVRCW